MIQVRSVFQAKADKGPELVALLKESGKQFPTQHEAHILTDTNGPVFTVVTEVTFDSVDAWEQEVLQAVAKPDSLLKNPSHLCSEPLTLNKLLSVIPLVAVSPSLLAGSLTGPLRSFSTGCRV